MKTKNRKQFLNMDERNMQVAYKAISILYLLTILAIKGIVIYRHLGLVQDISEFEDIAIIMTIDSLFLLSALLYFGAIPIRRLSIKSILLIYLLQVVLGSLFTFAKYNIFVKQGLSPGQLFDKLIIIVALLGTIIGLWVLLSLLGKRRLDKELK